MKTKPILENQIKRDILQILALHKIPAFRLNSGAVSSTYKGKKRYIKMTFNGCPDIVALLRTGETLWCEVKSKKGIMSSDQIIFQELCKARNVPHVVARSSQEIEQWLETYGII